MLNIYGVTMFYYPISEYDLNSISSLWGEDINKKYLEKYTIKGITEGENDTFSFNRFGVDKTSAERIVYISRKAFTEITSREEPLEGDMFLWTQNKIIYEVIEVTDQEHIVLGKELSLILVSTPRMVEGEVFGKDDCSNTRDDVTEKSEAEITGCDKDGVVVGDGNVIEDPDNVNVPGPSTHTNDDETTIDNEKDGVLIRNSWGNW